MNIGGQRTKNGKSGPRPLAFEGVALEVDESTDYHERELRFIAAFRLRDAAARIATLVSMSRSAQLRSDLLAIYDRLMAEERELVVRSLEPIHYRPPVVAEKSAASRTG